MAGKVNFRPGIPLVTLVIVAICSSTAHLQSTPPIGSGPTSQLANRKANQPTIQPANQPTSLRGYINHLPPEPAPAREARHRLIAQRRAGPVVIVHRGAHAFAPENTLEAYAAAMDYGADGCEIDLRRTSDGIIVLFHDDMLDQLTNGFGQVSDLSYFELLSLTPRFVYGTATRDTRPPTFVSVLALARQRAMLLHLDIKEPGLDEDLDHWLDAADMWDHVVAINEANAPRLIKHPKYQPLRYRAPGLYEGRRDMDPTAVQAALDRPGDMIMVDDPRVASRALKRTAYQPVPMPEGLRAEYQSTSGQPNPTLFIAFFHLNGLEDRVDRGSVDALTGLLGQHADERNRASGDGEYQRRRTEHIVERAWAAQRLGELGKRTARIVELLEFELKHRSLHADWRYHGLDGAMAARALGMLKAVESVPALREAFLRIDPLLEQVANPEFKANPLSWNDFRTKMYILPALGALRCLESKRFLLDYVAMAPERAREIAPLLYGAATAALFRQDLSADEMRLLLRSEHPAVRGTAILECLDHPTPDRSAALRQEHAWALELPQAK